MIFGNPYKFAILVEPIPNWSDETFINGLVFYIVDGLMLPFHDDGGVCNTTINSDLFAFKEQLTAWEKNPQNDEIFDMPKEKAFTNLLLQVWPNEVDESLIISDDFCEDYTHYLTSTMMQDSGSYCFLVGKGSISRVLLGKWRHLIENINGQLEWNKLEKPIINDVFLPHTELMEVFRSALKEIV